MVVRGTPAIGYQAAYGVALEASRLARGSKEAFAHGLARAFAVLAASRPTAVNLAWALERMKKKLESVQSEDPRARADSL